MKNTWRWTVAASGVVLGGALLIYAGPRPDESDVKNVQTGTSAFTSYDKESPGTFRKITVPDLPQPFATEAASNAPTVVPRPSDAWPKTLPGFKVDYMPPM